MPRICSSALLVVASIELLLSCAAAVPAGGKANPAAEEARWLVHAADWGYLSALDRGPAASQGAAGALHAATR